MPYKALPKVISKPCWDVAVTSLPPRVNPGQPPRWHDPKGWQGTNTYSFSSSCWQLITWEGNYAAQGLAMLRLMAASPKPGGFPFLLRKAEQRAQGRLEGDSGAQGMKSCTFCPSTA